MPMLDADGEAATEVLIDPRSGAVWIEYGPAMMWNTRYGMMGSSSLRHGQRMMGAMSMMGSGGMMGASGASGGWGMMGGRFRGDPTWTPFGGTAARQTISPQSATRPGSPGWPCASPRDALPGPPHAHCAA
jgi:hypothetical protein